MVGAEIDASTERIVRYLYDMDVPINLVTIQHFKDGGGRAYLARVFLIEPELAEAKSKSASMRRSITLTELQTEAEKNGVGEMFRRIREGTRGILIARPYFENLVRCAA